MSADPLQNVSSGDPLILRADSINAWNEAARRTRLDKYSGGAATDLDDVFPAVTVVVRNDTGADLPVRSVVYLSDWIVSPVTYPLEVAARPVLKAIAPTAYTNRIGILRDAIPDGEMGRAIVSGCAVVDVLVNDSNHTYAVPISADSTRLGSATSGPARIIKWESSGTTRRAIVLLGDGNAGAEILDLSGRSGSIADVTALQILRGVISGTAGAAVFTPDEATNSLPGIVSLSDQTMGDGVKTFLDGSANEGGIYVGTNGILAVYDPTVGAKEEHFNINRQAGGSIIEYDWYESTLSSVLLLKAYSAGPNGFMDLRVEWSVATQGVIAGSASGGADGRFGVNVGGTDFMGASGTSGGGDTVKGGIITTLGSGPTITNLTYSGSQAATGDISPSQLVADTNDWNPTGW